MVISLYSHSRAIRLFTPIEWSKFNLTLKLEKVLPLKFLHHGWAPHLEICYQFSQSFNQNFFDDIFFLYFPFSSYAHNVYRLQQNSPIFAVSIFYINKKIKEICCINRFILFTFQKKNRHIICFIIYLSQRIICFLQIMTTKSLNSTCRAITKTQILFQ